MRETPDFLAWRVVEEIDAPPAFVARWLMDLPPGDDPGPFRQGRALVHRDAPLAWRVTFDRRPLLGTLTGHHRVEPRGEGARLVVEVGSDADRAGRVALRALGLLAPLALRLIGRRRMRELEADARRETEV